MRRYLTILLGAAAGLALAAALVGCGSPEPVPPPTGPWSASLTGAGGFTGGGSSLTVHDDGRVELAHWMVAGDEPTVTQKGVAPPDLLAALLEAMRDGELRALPPGEPANMTMTLRWDHGDEMQQWMHSEGLPAPPPVERAVTALRAAADGAR